MAESSFGLSAGRLAGVSVLAQGQTDPRPAPNTIEAAHAALTAARELASRVEGMVDRLCGALPAQASSPDHPAPPGPTLRRLKDDAERTRDMIRSAEARLDDLERETA